MLNQKGPWTKKNVSVSMKSPFILEPMILIQCIHYKCHKHQTLLEMTMLYYDESKNMFFYENCNKRIGNEHKISQQKNSHQKRLSALEICFHSACPSSLTDTAVCEAISRFRFRRFWIFRGQGPASLWGFPEMFWETWGCLLPPGKDKGRGAT